MSIFRPETLPCPTCAEGVAFEVAHSVNADRRPDLRQDIVERRFQCETCPTCGTEFRRAPALTYMDVENRLWIIAAPATDLPGWGEMEATTTATFGRAFGPGSSPLAEEYATTLRPRLVFGWAALREKIVAAAAGLDDVVLEMLKLSFLRTGGADLLADGIELRLISVEGDVLKLAAIDSRTDRLEELVSVPRGAYDAIAAAPEAWAPLRAELTAGPFVDIDRMMVAPAVA